MEEKYYLAVETKPNNYFPINLNDLKIFEYTTEELNELDALTLKYTKSEIINAIKEANLLEVNEFMPLVVIYYEKDHARKINALTKDITYDMWASLNENYEDKTYRNKIINFLNNKASKEEIDEIKSSNNLESFLQSISKLSYLNQRKLYLYLYENGL